MTVLEPSPLEPAQQSDEHHVTGTGWDRSSALAGALFLILIVAQSALRSGAPSATASGQEIVDFVTEHQGRLQLGAALLGLAMAAALVWLPALYRTLRRAEGTNSGFAVAAVAGGVVAAAGGAMTALIQGTIAARIGELDEASIGVWWTMWMLSIGAIVLGLLVTIGVTAVISLRRHLFARWFTMASVLLALVSVVGVFTLGYAAAGVQTVAGIAVLLDSVWILVMSIFLWRDPSLD
jgi:hypothetical protein